LSLFQSLKVEHNGERQEQLSYPIKGIEESQPF